MSNILLNRIKTPDGTILISTHRHDYVAHQDKNGKMYAVDGGNEYLRRVGSSDYEDMSVSDEDEINVVDFREYFTWGTYGKSGEEEYKRVTLCNLSNPHIEAIIKTQKQLSDTIVELLKLELEYREREGIMIEDA
jgi:hypothetical protein